MAQNMEDVLNQPRVAAWLIKGLVKECNRLSVDEIMDVYIPKTHRWVSSGSPDSSWTKKCRVMDMDVPLNMNLEDLSPVDAFVYDKVRSQLLYLNADFYAVCAEDMRRGFRITFDFSKDLDVSYVEDHTLVIRVGENEIEVPSQWDFAHLVTIHVGNRTEDTAPSYLKMLPELYHAFSSSEVLGNTYGIRL